MRKNVFGRQFKRDVNERRALFKGLMSSLVLEDRIQTTEEKAKAIKSQVEKLVTKARVGERHAESLLQPYLNAEAVKKMMTQIAPMFTKRQGGYTRIIKIGKRFSDNASVVLMEWVEKPLTVSLPEKKTPKKSAPKKTAQKINSKTTKSKKTPILKDTTKKEAKA